MEEVRDLEILQADRPKHMFRTIRFVEAELGNLEKKEVLTMRDLQWIRRNIRRMEMMWNHDYLQMKESSPDNAEDSYLREMFAEVEAKAGAIIRKHDQINMITKENAYWGSVPEEEFPEGIDEKLKPIYFRILDVVSALEDAKNKPVLNHKDIGRIQSYLHEIDWKFKDFRLTKEGDIPAGQAAISDMLENLFDEIHEITGQLPEEIPPLKEEVSPLMEPIKRKLEKIIDSLEIIGAKSVGDVSLKEIGNIQNKLSQVDQRYRQARFEKLSQIPEGQALVSELLEHAHEMVREIVYNIPEEEFVDEKLKPVETKINSIIADLQALLLKPSDSVTLKDIGKIQNKLSRVDNSYREGKFIRKGEIPPGQGVLSDSLDKAHQLVRRVQDRIEMRSNQ